MRQNYNKKICRARTQILKQQDGKDREKYVMKFIKIMKHLRKINNYNSYLALLSALGKHLKISLLIHSKVNIVIHISRLRSHPSFGMAKEYN